MKNKITDSQDQNSMTTIHRKNEIGLPLLALGLDLIPILLVFLSSLGLGLPSFVLLFMVLSPIVGLITGVISLSRGKERIGIVGKILAITAIALPLILVIIIVIFFIGVATGVISLM